MTGSGLVSGLVIGSASITAAAEGVSATTTVNVVQPEIAISAITPDPAVAGGTVTISGTGLDIAGQQVAVTIDGAPAEVIAVGPAGVQVRVPERGCVPEQPVEFRVTVGQKTGTRNHRVGPATFVSVPVGQQLLLRDPADFCLQFDDMAAGGAYLIGVQSVLEQPLLTSARLTAAADPTATPSRGMARPAARIQVQRRQPLGEQPPRFEPHLGRTRWPGGALPAAGVSSAPVLPPTVSVGDSYTISVNFFATNCFDSPTVDARVRWIGQHAIFLEDVLNPPGGFADSDYQQLSDFFDNWSYPPLSAFFGPPSDQDSNGKVAIVITKLFNDPIYGGIGGVVGGWDHNSRATCPASNEGEFMFLGAPDPLGMAGAPYDVATALEGAKAVVGHELVHIIQHRPFHQGSGPLPEAVWMKEGGAMLGEELILHNLGARSSGQDYGGDIATLVFGHPLFSSYVGLFNHLAWYYGFFAADTRVEGAPEQCSWLERPSPGNQGPCAWYGSLTYGVSWSFLRWLTDQFGPDYPGGPGALHRAFIEKAYTPFRLVEIHVGRPFDELLALWAAMLYVDNRVPNAASELTLSSWNLFDIERYYHETARLQPYERGFADSATDVMVRGASTAYFRFSGSGRPATAIRVRSPDGSALPGHMRVWIVRLE